jgi:DNA-binding NarL/FixJ family response regulator
LEHLKGRQRYIKGSLQEHTEGYSNGEVAVMARDITITQRELSPFEQLVLGLLCEGKTNSAIARETNHTEKVVENTVSRSAKAFGITSDGDTNIRVLLALAFRTHYGDLAFDRLGLPCSHMDLNGEGQAICNRDVH